MPQLILLNMFRHYWLYAFIHIRFMKLVKRSIRFFMQTICRIAVPFFFTTSGFFFFRKYGDDSEENTKNLRKYLMRLLKIYLIWTVIYLPYTIWDQYQAGFSILGVFSYIRDFFLNGSYYHLWFYEIVSSIVYHSFSYFPLFW